MNDFAQAILLLSGPAGAAVVWWLKRQDDRRLRARVDECERDRAALRADRRADRREIDELKGSVATLTALLRKEIHVD